MTMWNKSSAIKMRSVGLLLIIVNLILLCSPVHAGDGMKAFYTSPVYKKLRKGEYDEALKTCAKLRKMKLNKDYVCFLEGLAYYMKEDLQNAISSFTDAIWLNDERGDALYMRARARAKMDKYDAALADLNKAIALPDSVKQIALFNEKIGFTGKEPYLESDLYLTRAEVHYFKGNLDLALKDVNHAINVRPRPNNLTHLVKGYTLFRQNQLDTAYDSFATAYKLNPESAEPLKSMDTIAFYRGDYQDDLKLCKKILELEPDNNRTRMSLGLANWALGNREQGLAELEQASHNTEDANIWYHLGYFQHQAGQQDNALASFRKAHQLDPEILANRKKRIERVPASSPTRTFYQDEYKIAETYIETGKTPDAIALENQPATLLISDLNTTPGIVAVKQPFKINVHFTPDVPGEEKIVDADFSFTISRNNQVLFTSDTIRIRADNRENNHYQATMSPVPVAGEFQINATVSVQDLTETSTALLTIQ